MCSTNVGTSIGFALISINFSLDSLGLAMYNCYDFTRL